MTFKMWRRLNWPVIFDMVLLIGEMSEWFGDGHLVAAHALYFLWVASSGPDPQLVYIGIAPSTSIDLCHLVPTKNLVSSTVTWAPITSTTFTWG